MKKVLITGYGPFLNHKTNPSIELAQLLEAHSFSNIKVTSHELPVVFANVGEALKDLAPWNYDYCLCLGLAGSREVVTPELVAINFLHSPGRVDNEGKEFSFEKIKPQGKDCYFSSLPINEWLSFDDDWELSLTAGSYVCNQTFYLLMEFLEKREAATKAGFIHIPNISLDSLENSFVRRLETLA